MPSRRRPRPEKCCASTRGDPHAAHVVALLPVALEDPVGRNTPGVEVRPDTERHEEHGIGEVDEPADGVHVEVVVVVVGDHDGVDPAQPGERHRHGVQPARAEVLAR